MTIPKSAFVLPEESKPLSRPARNSIDIGESSSIDDFAQGPSGVWYPTCVHKKEDDGDPLIWYFVDFKAKLPDSLFKPEPRTGDIE